MQATQDIDFAINGTTEDTALGVTLNGSETFSGQFTHATTDGDAPAVSISVLSEDDSGTETVTVNEPAGFAVTITSVDSVVTEGETITVAYEVTNTGDQQGTQDIIFAINGTTEDTESGVTLNGSETFSGQFTYDTVAGDAPAVTVAVSSADDSASSTVTVNEPSSFVVEIVETNTPIEGEQLNVTATVENTGDVEDTQTINLSVGALGTDSTAVTLGGGASTNVTLSVGTGAGDAGEYTATVSSADDSASANVSVLASAEFVVSIVETNTPVEGASLTVTATIENTGDVEDTQTIELSVGALGTDSTSVTLGGGSSTNVTLSVGTGAGDAGEYTATVSSADDSASANVTVLASAAFVVEIVETNTPVEGEQLNVTATIENTGDVQDTQTVTLDVGPLDSDSTTVTLGGGTSTNVTLSVGTGAGDSGAYTAIVSSANATTSANVTVLTPAQFVVSSLTAPAETTVGTSLNVSATVTNIGGTDGLQAVAFQFDGQTVANRTVSLIPNASTTVTFTPTVPDQTGTFEHGVFTDDDNQTAEITVVDPDPPNVTLSNLRIAGDGDNATVMPGNYDVSINLSHDDGPNGTVPMELTIGNATTSKNVSLNASETKLITFENVTGGLSPAVYDVTVSAVDASLTGELTLSVLMGDNTDPATDTDDDRLLEDTDGDGSFTIFDVQAFFVEFQSDPVQTAPALFNFDGSEDSAVTIFDVQALFLELAG